MKLIIRTAYWGQVLRGKTLDRVSPGARQSRSISSQAVIKNEGQFWGCCPTQGKRVLEMTERHFLDAYDGDWGTFQQFRTIRSRHCCFLTACIFFFLVSTQICTIPDCSSIKTNLSRFIRFGSFHKIKTRLTSIKVLVFMGGNFLGPSRLLKCVKSFTSFYMRASSSQMTNLDTESIMCTSKF